MVGSSATISSNELSFFKVISTSQKLEFPPESFAKLQGILGNRVTLRDAHKNLWRVEVRRGEKGFFFDKGWPQFYLENGLQPRDIVVFEYKHDNLLDFRLFGRDACQRFGVKKEAEDEHEDEDGDDEEVCMNKNKAKSKKDALRHDIKDYYGHDIFELGLAIRPQNPYFVSRSRKTRKNELYIPNHVIEEGKLKIESRMLVVDASGRRWESKIKKWKDGRVWCTRGWKRLCNANNIGPRDICICEFVQRGARTLHMLVRVVDLVK